MTTSLPPYPAYAPSGVPWLGDVPAHWMMRRLRNAASLLVSNVDKRSNEGEVPVRLCNYTDVYKHDRIVGRMPFMRATATEGEVRRFRLEVGDVIITKDSEMWNDIGVPALVEYSAPDLLCGYHLAILRPNPEAVTGGYLNRSLQARGVEVQFHVAANGVTRYGLSHNAIKQIIVPLPPLPEQQAIVRYLDHHDRLIRRYIRARQRLVSLLTEQKQAIIQRAVTRGLDPAAPLKPSGVEWLGDVPAHWEVRRLKTLCSMKSGYSITAQTIEPHGEFPVYGGNGLRGFTSTFTHEGNYALIGRQGALCGNVHVAHGRFFASEHAVVAAMFQGHDLKWFAHVLRAMNLNQYSIAAAQPGLSVERVLNLWLSVPPHEEQERIAYYISIGTAPLDRAIAAARRQIELMREYRTRLIADVVTGKVDVRGVALPEDEEGATDDAALDADTDLDDDGDGGDDGEDVGPGADAEE